MAFIRQWLIGVTGAALLAAMADGLMPKGPVKQVGKLVCGLVLLCVILRPVIWSELDEAMQQFGQITQQTARQQEKLDGQRDDLLKAGIEQECSAYIVDKAAQLGIVCQAQTECIPGQDGTWLPGAVQITGQLDAGQRQALTRMIEEELGVDAAHQLYSGGG